MKLSRIQLACVPELARGDTIESVASAHELDRRTVERWLRKREFVEFLEASITKRLERALEDNSTALTELGPLSVDALKRVLQNPREASVQDTLRAAQIVQNALLKVMEYKRPHVFRSKS